MFQPYSARQLEQKEIQFAHSSSIWQINCKWLIYRS